MTKLIQIANGYRKMTNGGALLTVSENGIVGNGMVIIERFSSRKDAVKALKSAGFQAQGSYWKLAA